MKTRNISIEDARNLALSSQLLIGANGFKNKKDLLAIITRLGYIQIDTISIVERAHKHVLWTRLPEYRNEMLDELIDKDKKVFEFWDHAAAYMPMKHFRFTLPRKLGRPITGNKRFRAIKRGGSDPKRPTEQAAT